ncbi:coagulation factor IX-like isoform X2 [Xyrauchen texanus]|uniref:coagulation factor IX-like isoform X2 n=1 Tax=Xyrauchen texanus TaxID=154827 RepID=UPI002241F935|nr:coagulation factor IX-like isoform X2 [Xyrauchen texanus]
MGRTVKMRKQCNVNNGGCMYIYFVDQIYGVVCDCADGYRLALDSRTCEPTGKYPCGHHGDIVGSLKRSLTNAENGNQILPANTTEYNATETSPTDNTTVTSPADPPAVYKTITPRPMMENIPSWAFFPTLPTIKNATKNVQRIVGGNEATPGEIPWQVVLMHKLNKMAFCGGSILNEDWVITAAHCIEGRIGTFFIRAGEHDITKKEGKESDYDTAECHIHPHYSTKKGLFNHDIALLKLQTPVQFSDYALPICLGSKDFTEKLLRSAPNSLVSGWGRLRYGGIESNTLQKVEVPYVDRTECKTSSTDKITHFMFCAGYNTVHKDSCQGDSGGPHATHYQNTWYLTGIVSWGDECAKDGKYGIYTRVSKYMFWISKITGIRIGQ